MTSGGPGRIRSGGRDGSDSTPWNKRSNQRSLNNFENTCHLERTNAGRRPRFGRAGWTADHMRGLVEVLPVFTQLKEPYLVQNDLQDEGRGVATWLATGKRNARMHSRFRVRQLAYDQAHLKDHLRCVRLVPLERWWCFVHGFEQHSQRFGCMLAHSLLCFGRHWRFEHLNVDVSAFALVIFVFMHA